MSLLNKASLLQIPSGYKDGTLYSAKPTNGDGDFTFSRGSNLAATRVNSDGLIEKGRENLLLQSNQFDTTWVTANSSVTSGQSGYDGSNDAWLLDKSGASGRITQTKSVTGIFTFSVYVKKGTTDWILLYKTGTGEGGRFFDLTNGVTGSSISTAPIGSKIESVGNDWYRCSIVGNSANAVVMYVADSDGGLTDTSGNIYIQDSQLELGLIATDYIETGASTAQAGILEDMPRLDYSGDCPSCLLEPQRTNINTNSEYFGSSNWNKARMSITDNAVTSPEGVQNGANFVEDSTSNSHPLFDTFTVSSGTSYTVSMFAKKGSRDYFRFNAATSSTITFFNLANGTVHSGTGEIEDFGNGWYRCSMSFTATSTSEEIYIEPSINGSSANYQGDGSVSMSIYGFQLEAGSYVSSYIPTYGASVTRGIDDAVATHTISDTETLTYYTEFIAPEQANGGGEHLLDNSSGSARARIYQNNSTSIRIRTDSPSANFDYTYSSLGIDVGDTVKIALSIDSGVMTAFINGVKKNTFGSATFNFGRLHLRPQTIITYNTGIIFNSALSDDECIQLTTI